MKNPHNIIKITDNNGKTSVSFTAKCCTCQKKQTLAYWSWSAVQIELDYIAYECPDCDAKRQKRYVEEYEKTD